MELGTGTRLRPGGLQSPDVDGLSSVRWAVLDGMGLGTALSADGASVDVQDGASDGTLAVLQLVGSVHSLTLRCS